MKKSNKTKTMLLLLLLNNEDSSSPKILTINILIVVVTTSSSSSLLLSRQATGYVTVSLAGWSNELLLKQRIHLLNTDIWIWAWKPFLKASLFCIHHYLSTVNWQLSHDIISGSWHHRHHHLLILIFFFFTASNW